MENEMRKLLLASAILFCSHQAFADNLNNSIFNNTCSAISQNGSTHNYQDIHCYFNIPPQQDVTCGTDNPLSNNPNFPYDRYDQTSDYGYDVDTPGFGNNVYSLSPVEDKEIPQHHSSLNLTPLPSSVILLGTGLLMIGAML